MHMQDCVYAIHTRECISKSHLVTHDFIPRCTQILNHPFIIQYAREKASNAQLHDKRMPQVTMLFYLKISYNGLSCYSHIHSSLIMVAFVYVSVKSINHIMFCSSSY